MLSASSSLCCGVLSTWEEHEEKKRSRPAVAMAVAMRVEEDGEGLVRQNCEESISRPAGARIKPVERKGEQFVDPCVVSQHVDNREDGGRSAKRTPRAWVSAAHPSGTQILKGIVYTNRRQ
jgi:hypothetical protein